MFWDYRLDYWSLRVVFSPMLVINHKHSHRLFSYHHTKYFKWCRKKQFCCILLNIVFGFCPEVISFLENWSNLAKNHNPNTWVWYVFLSKLHIGHRRKKLSLCSEPFSLIDSGFENNCLVLFWIIKILLTGRNCSTFSSIIIEGISSKSGY